MLQLAKVQQVQGRGLDGMHCGGSRSHPLASPLLEVLGPLPAGAPAPCVLFGGAAGPTPVHQTCVTMGDGQSSLCRCAALLATVTWFYWQSHSMLDITHKQDRTSCEAVKELVGVVAAADSSHSQQRPSTLPVRRPASYLDAHAH